jgi:hypothetical protein
MKAFSAYNAGLSSIYSHHIARNILIDKDSGHAKVLDHADKQ